MSWVLGIGIAVGLVCLGRFGLQMWSRLQARRDRSWGALLLYFRQKVWMTAGLGLFFISLYLLLAVCGRCFVTSENFSGFLVFGKEHPSLILYLGLLVVALNSMLIYCVRLCVKALFHRTEIRKKMRW
jgi:hypothetical protein